MIARKHNTVLWILVIFAILSTMPVRASDAESWARATGGGWRPGTAAAGARYEGDFGFARSDTRTGKMNFARGVAVGVDENGLSLSISTAIAPNRGPALATNFNLSIGSDGEVAASTGRVLAEGGARRTAETGGFAGATPRGAASLARAGGDSGARGVVHAVAHSEHYRPQERVIPRRVIRVR